jgi:hypothetical protein
MKRSLVGLPLDPETSSREINMPKQLKPHSAQKVSEMGLNKIMLGDP